MLIHNADITGSLLVNGTGYNTGSFSGSFIGEVAGTTATASYVEYNNVANKPALVSGSSQIAYSGLTGIPSGIVSGSSQVTYSGLTGIPSGIVSGSAQISNFGIFATTGSNQFNGSQAITGSLTVTGQVVAQTLNVQQVTSSIVFSSGSNIFGNSLANTQQFTGSLQVTGSSHNILGNVGIGPTGNPAAELQVGKASDVTIAMSNSNSITSGVRGNITWYNSSNSTVANIRATAVTDNVGTQLEFYTRPAAGSLTQRLTLDASGNLGLGVTPSAWNVGRVLQINTSGAFVYGSSNNTIYGLNAFFESGWKYINTAAASYYEQFAGAHQWFNASSGTAGNAISFTQAMTLDASGRLGIGTESPSQRLHVANSTGTVVAFLQSTATNGEATISLQGRNSSGTVRSATFKYDNADLLRIGTSSPIDFRFETNDTERMRITSGGNVGIGASNPNAKLDINGGDLYVRTGGGIYSNTFGTYNGGSTQLFFAYPAEGSVAFHNGSERLRIDAGGHLGLGITPQTWWSSRRALEMFGGGAFSGVNAGWMEAWGNSYLDGSATTRYLQNGSAGLYQVGNLSPGNSHVWHTAPSGTAGNPITFTQAMTLDTSGNLLLNTTSLGSLGNGIILRGDNDGAGGYGYIQIGGNASTTRGIYLYNPNGLVGAIGTDGTSLLFATGGSDTERMRITSGGRVGIGTTSPDTLLHVRGYEATNWISTQTNTGTSGHVMYFGYNNNINTTYGLYIEGGRGNANQLDFAVVNKFYVNGDGKVGVGTSSPTALLDVQGPSGTSGSTLFTIQKAGGFGATEFFQYYNSSSDYGINFGLAVSNATNGRAGIIIRSDTSGNGTLVFNTTATERMRITSGGVVRINGFTSNGLVGTDASGNLGVVNNTYTEIATGTITYSMTAGISWAINNSFPATIRNYEDDSMVGSGNDTSGQNQGRGVTFDLGSAKAVRKIVERGYPTKNLDNITVQYSTDNSNWTTIHTYRHVYGNTQKDMEFNPTGAISARYWRWFIDGWTTREVQNYYTYESIIYT